jgi:hypothetical protein
MTHPGGWMAVVMRWARRRRTGIGSQGLVDQLLQRLLDGLGVGRGSPLASRVAIGWIDLRLPSSNSPRRELWPQRRWSLREMGANSSSANAARRVRIRRSWVGVT